MEIWFGAQDRIAVSVRPPGGDWIGPVEPRQYIQNRMLRDGSMLSIYNEVYHPANGLNHISVFLSPFFSQRGDHRRQSRHVDGAAARPRDPRRHGFTPGSSATIRTSSAGSARRRRGGFRRSSPSRRWWTTRRSARSAARIA